MLKEVILFLILSAGGGWHEVQEEGAYSSDQECREVGREYMRAHPERVSGFICRGNGVTGEHQSN